jgi:subfamily B ATP-binding cassette protein MsbA
MSFKIPQNTSVALVGASGSGKSTIASLLLRFYEHQGGSIEIDGVDIKNYNISSLRQ